MGTIKAKRNGTYKQFYGIKRSLNSGHGSNIHTIFAFAWKSRHFSQTIQFNTPSFANIYVMKTHKRRSMCFCENVTRTHTFHKCGRSRIWSECFSFVIVRHSRHARVVWRHRATSACVIQLLFRLIAVDVVCEDGDLWSDGDGDFLFATDIYHRIGISITTYHTVGWTAVYRNGVRFGVRQPAVRCQQKTTSQLRIFIGSCNSIDSTDIRNCCGPLHPICGEAAFVLMNLSAHIFFVIHCCCARRHVYLIISIEYQISCATRIHFS